MKNTVIPRKVKVELNRLKKDPFDPFICAQHPSYFAKHFLGITPYAYQHQVLRRYAVNSRLKNDRVIICSSRQIGKSVSLACLAIWYAFNNIAPSGVHDNTKVGIISDSDEASITLMSMIQNIIYDSPFNLEEYILKKRGKSFTRREFNFKRGFVKCFPPTKKAVRGKTFDLVMVDEGGHVEDKIFHEVIEPTVSAVNGKIIITSTPAGQSGFFFELFDPYELRKFHEYKRYWFNWKVCENDMQKRIIKQKLKHAKETGNLKSFDQEYNALFTVDKDAFFEDRQIDNGIDPGLVSEYENKDVPISIGIDYGIKESETAISVVGKFKNQLRLLFQYSKPNFDCNLLTDSNWEHSIINLAKRYNVSHFVVDDCAPGDTTNKWMEKNGYPIIRFNFRSDQMAGERNRGYYIFREYLKKGNIKYPNLRKLIAEMKSIQEIKMEINLRVKAPKNYRDDLIDSFMMACYPFLVSNNDFSSMLVEYENAIKSVANERRIHDGRFDSEWERLKNMEAK